MTFPQRKREFDQIIAAITQAQYDSDELDFSDFGLTDQDCLQVMEALNLNPQLKTALRSLNFSNNHLESFPSYFDFPNLINLDLRFNRIQSIEQQLNGAPLLQQLLLQENHLSYIEALSCPNLIYLDLSSNQLERPPELSELNQLVHLDIHNNLLIFPPILATNPALEYVNLSGNHIPEELADLFVAVMQTHQSTTQVNIYPLTKNTYPILRDIDSLRHYCVAWAEHYCQRFATEAMNEDGRKQLAQTVACAKKQAVTFPKMITNIKNSVPEQFVSSLNQFIDTLHWLITFSGRLSPQITHASEAIAEEAKQYGFTFFSNAWEQTWGSILEISDAINKVSKMKEKLGGAAGPTYSKRQAFDGPPNPFLNAKSMPVQMETSQAQSSMPFYSKYSATQASSEQFTAPAVLNTNPIGQLHAFNQSSAQTSAAPNLKVLPQLKVHFP